MNRCAVAHCQRSSITYRSFSVQRLSLGKLVSTPGFLKCRNLKPSRRPLHLTVAIRVERSLASTLTEILKARR